MRTYSGIVALILVLVTFFPSVVVSFERDEHQHLTGKALHSALLFFGGRTDRTMIHIPNDTAGIAFSKYLWKGLRAGEISARYSVDDISRSHYHELGQTVMQQLEHLKATDIDAVWKLVKNSPYDIQAIDASGKNVVSTYLLYHLLALRFAEYSGTSDQDRVYYLRRALLYESIAQCFLADAFSSGHFFLPHFDIIAPLNGRNMRINHDHFCHEGVYVINSRGESWLAFGDKLLQWYSSSYHHVLNACTESFQEVFLVCFVSGGMKSMTARAEEWSTLFTRGSTIQDMTRSWTTSADGVAYYAQYRMPALQCIPMPISAVWSIRSKATDRLGLHARVCYPQLTEDGYHDPDLSEIERSYLYSQQAVPQWMIPDFLPSDSLRQILRYRSDVASVCFIQERYYPPSFEGVLIQAGCTFRTGSVKTTYGIYAGIGWGFADDFLLALYKPSISVSMFQFYSDIRQRILAVDINSGINISGLGIFRPYFGTGYAWGFDVPNEGGAGKYEVGLISETMPLRFTYAGCTFRLKYQHIAYSDAVDMAVLEMILH